MSYPLKFGKTVTIDPNGPTNPVLLTISLRRMGLHQIPIVRVIEKYVGFTAAIRALTLTKSTSKSDTYEIAVDWTPGGDHSGARILVVDPYDGRQAQAHIEMIA